MTHGSGGACYRLRVAVGGWSWRWVPLVGALLVSCGRPSSSTPHEVVPYVLRWDARSAGLEGRGQSARGQSAWIQDVLASAMTHAQYFRAEGDGERLTARLRYEERRSDQGHPVLGVYLVIEPDDALAADMDATGGVLDANVELERRDHTLDLRRDLPIAVERALALLDAKVTIARGTAQEVAALLHDEDPEVILVALDGVERRRLRSLGDQVHTLLGHAQERVAIRAVECLGVVGGPEHAPGLLRSARLADRAHAHRLYEALANLGGEHARGFLEFAARNEEDPELASRAERALARLDDADPRPLKAAVARGHRQ
ncbi:MAG: HEAT repeat domain-containing protein [Myxococcota bacterium]